MRRVFRIYQSAGATITTLRAQHVAQPVAAPLRCRGLADVAGRVVSSPVEKAARLETGSRSAVMVCLQDEAQARRD